MTKILFKKMHGCGNDFVIIDNRQAVKLSLSAEQIKKIANRHYGIGCDQLIVMDSSDKGDCQMIIYNSDGSQAASCGNATRCVAKIITQESKLTKATIVTYERILYVTKNEDLFTVNMGKPNFDWEQVPLSHKMDTLNLPLELDDLINPVAVSMGNPHVVFFVADIDAIDIAKIGPQLENHSFFPEKVNVNFAHITDEHHINLRIWERGAGETLACGSGACATYSAAKARNLIEDEVTFTLAGGKLLIRQEQGEILMTGPAISSFTGAIEV